MPSSSNPFAILGIEADQLRCLYPKDIQRLIIKVTRDNVRRYGKGSKEAEIAIDAKNRLLGQSVICYAYARILLKETLDKSLECIKNGIDLSGTSIEIIDIFDRHSCFDESLDDHTINRIIYSFDANNNLSITCHGRKRDDTNNRKIVGCIKYATMPYELLNSIIKNRAVSRDDDSYIRFFGGGNVAKRCYKKRNVYNSRLAKSIPIDLLPFGIEHYIFPCIDLHGILISLDNKGNLIPEGKIEHIIKK